MAYDYRTGMLHRDPGDPSSPRLEPAEILARSGVRARQLASVVGSRLREQVVGKPRLEGKRFFAHLVISSALMALLAVALVKRRTSAEIFCLATLVSILFFFGFRERLVLPVFALAVSSAVGVLREGLLKLQRNQASHIVTIAGCSCILLVTAFDTSYHQGWNEIESLHIANTQRFEALEAAMGDDARVGVLGDQKMISVYLEREVPTTHIAVRRAHDLEAIEEIVDKYDLNTIISLENAIKTPKKNRGTWRDERATSRFLTRRYGEGTQVGIARFWRVRP